MDFKTIVLIALLGILINTCVIADGIEKIKNCVC